MEINPCRNCGLVPNGVSAVFHHRTDGNRYEIWIECTRWFGLRLCQRGPSHWNLKDWADVAHRCAIEKWNELNPQDQKDADRAAGGGECG